MTFSWQFSDDLAGVNYCAMAFYSPSGQQNVNMTGWATFNLVSGDANNGLMEATNVLSQYSEPGVWTAGYVFCYDRVGNSRYYDANTPPPFAFPSFTVTSQGDTQAPQINAASMQPGSVDVSQSPATMTFRWEVQDDLSGVNYCAMAIYSPSGQQNINMTGWASFNLVSGNPNNGVIEATNVLSQHSESGVWTAGYIFCYDAVGNSRYYDSNTPPPFGWPTFTVVSASDVTAPVIIAASIRPLVVDVSAADATMTFHWEFQDDLSGLNYCAMAFYSPSGQQNINMTGWGHFNLVAGDANGGVMEAVNVLPRYSESGVWTAGYIFCYDQAGNSRYYDSTHPPPFAFPTFTVAPHDPASLLAGLIARVRELEAGGALSNGEANALIAKLQAAVEQVERGNRGAASNQISAFINQVDALESSRRLSQTNAQDLRNRAQRVLERLEGL